MQDLEVKFTQLLRPILMLLVFLKELLNLEKKVLS